MDSEQEGYTATGGEGLGGVRQGQVRGEIVSKARRLGPWLTIEAIRRSSRVPTSYIPA